MTNPYGITLDDAWTEWAAEYGVSQTVSAALFLVSESRPLDDIVAKLAPNECEQVIDIVRHWPDHFPRGTLTALEGWRCTLSPGTTAAGVLPDVTPSQPAARINRSPGRMRQTHAPRPSRPRAEVPQRATRELQSGGGESPDSEGDGSQIRRLATLRT